MLFTHLFCDVAEAELYRDEPRPNAKPSRMVCHESSIILVTQAFRPFSPSEAVSRAHGHRAVGAPRLPRRRLGCPSGCGALVYAGLHNIVPDHALIGTLSDREATMGTV